MVWGLKVLGIVKATGLSVEEVGALPLRELHYWNTVTRVNETIRGHYMKGPDKPGRK